MQSATSNITPVKRPGLMLDSDPLLKKHMQSLGVLRAHGNRVLRVDQLLRDMLQAFFDPLIRSLRLMQDCGNFDGRLNLARLARSTTSDALTTFDPRLLEPLMRDLHRRCPQLSRVDADLAGITRRIIAADGTYLTTLSNMLWALHHTKTNSKPQAQVRANVQLDVMSWVPQVLSISGEDDGSEPAAVGRDLLSEVLYVFDRNFLDFDFLGQLPGKNNDFVLRIRSNAPATVVLSDNALSAQEGLPRASSAINSWRWSEKMRQRDRSG